jgi:organic radical activating enzyme
MIPISLVKIANTKFRSVEWKLGNTCNFNCSFCSSENKSGTEYWLDLETYIDVCKQLMNSTTDKIFFHFTGGEPALFPELINLLRFIKEQGHYTAMFSNGSRTLRWWKEIAELDLLDVLYLTVHVEQGIDVDHIIDIIKLFEQKPVFVFSQSTAPVSHFDQAYLAHKKILKNTCVVGNLKPITTGYRHDSYIDRYSEDQLEILKNNVSVKSLNYDKIKPSGVRLYAAQMMLTYDDNTRKIYPPHKLISAGLNSFKGWNCSIGINSLTILYDKVYRGVCREGGIVHQISDADISFKSTEITCGLDRCTCAADLLEKKINIVWQKNHNTEVDKRDK